MVLPGADGEPVTGEFDQRRRPAALGSPAHRLWSPAADAAARRSRADSGCGHRSGCAVQHSAAVRRPAPGRSRVQSETVAATHGRRSRPCPDRAPRAAPATERTASREEGSVPGESPPGQLVLPCPHLRLVCPHAGRERLGVLTGHCLPQRGHEKPRRREEQRETDVVDEARRALDRPDTAAGDPPPSGSGTAEPYRRGIASRPRLRHRAIEPSPSDSSLLPRPGHPATKAGTPHRGEESRWRSSTQLGCTTCG